MNRAFTAALLMTLFNASLTLSFLYPLAAQGGPQQNFVSPNQIRILSQNFESNDPIVEYPIPTPNAGPNAVVAGPNTTLWFVEFSAGKIGEFFIENYSFQEFRVPETGATPASLAIDHFGNIWFSDQHGSGSIWMFNPSSGQFRKFATLTNDSTPLFIVFDNQNNVWFTEITGNKIGELNYPTYAMSEYTVPAAASGPVEMVYQQNKSELWITQTYSGQLASFNMTSRTFREYDPSISMNNPVGVVLDKRGDIWISEHRGSSIIEFNPLSNSWAKFPTSPPPQYTGYPISAPATLAIDASGNLWFVEHFSNKIGRLDPSTDTLQEFNIPNTNAYSVLNVIDSKGNFWFTQFAADAIGFVPASATVPLTVNAGNLSSSTINTGQSETINLIVANNSTERQRLQFNVSSSFSATGYTPSSQVSLDEYSAALDAGSAITISATITPPDSLESGNYSVGFVVASGNYSIVRTLFISVVGSPFLFLEQNSLEFVLLGAVVALVGFYFFVIRRGKR